MYTQVLSATLLASLFVLAAPAMAPAKEIEESRFTVADQWWGGAVAFPDGGFDYCSVSMRAGETITLSYILRSDDAFVIIVSIAGEDFPTGEIVEVALNGDNFGADRLGARVVDPATISIPMPGIEQNIALVRPTSHLSLKVQDRPAYLFLTPGSEAAVDAVLACFAKYSRSDAGQGTGSQVPAP